VDEEEEPATQEDPEVRVIEMDGEPEEGPEQPAGRCGLPDGTPDLGALG
jgi:hypothetical protein